jgi:hypothetical protein
MARLETTRPIFRDSRIEREVERERNEHASNHDAKAHLGDAEEDRHKDARETTFSSQVRR